MFARFSFGSAPGKAIAAAGKFLYGAALLELGEHFVE